MKKKNITDFYNIIGKENEHFNKFNLIFNKEQINQKELFRKMFTDYLDININYILELNNDKINLDEIYLVFHKWKSFSSICTKYMNINKIKSIENGKTYNPNNNMNTRSYSFLPLEHRNLLINNSNSILILYTSFSGSEVRDFITYWKNVKDWFKCEGIHNDRIRIVCQNYKSIVHPIIKSFDSQYYVFKNYILNKNILNRLKLNKKKRIIILNRRHNNERLIITSFISKFNNVNISYTLIINKIDKLRIQKYMIPFTQIIKKYDIHIDDFIKKLPLYLDELNSKGDVNWGNTSSLDAFYDDSYFFVCIETNYEKYSSNIQQISEKTYKPIFNKMPFLIWTTTGGILKYLKSLGFKTFHSIIDESYDDENKTYIERLIIFIDEINKIIKMDEKDINDKYISVLPIIEYNYNLMFK